ncbi:hypothetical protein AZE42_09599 [Rhizopogon vesiculosus]|uniref:Uncharacterized protein n=1 Tax=Rhizopogon vesiculosus TaxID=180088 RepID=A0A1J8QVD8_9AGAM|nr:hypothetical protein AZE42_09599 [Rhizopogon vesiculosus]
MMSFHIYFTPSRVPHLAESASTMALPPCYTHRRNLSLVPSCTIPHFRFTPSFFRLVAHSFVAPSTLSPMTLPPTIPPQPLLS